jgi:hypothetical protein
MASKGWHLWKVLVTAHWSMRHLEHFIWKTWWEEPIQRHRDTRRKALKYNYWYWIKHRHLDYALLCNTELHVSVLVDNHQGENVPISLYGPGQDHRGPELLDNRHINVARLSALSSGRLYPPGLIPGTHFYYRLSRPHGESGDGEIKSIKNSNNPIGDRIRKLSAIAQNSSGWV